MHFFVVAVYHWIGACFTFIGIIFYSNPCGKTEKIEKIEKVDNQTQEQGSDESVVKKIQ